MEKTYVVEQEGAYRLAGTRVSLDSIVHAYWNGESPETMVQAFPGLNLEQVYGAITFYLANQAIIDAYLRQGQAEASALRASLRTADPAFYEKLARARREVETAGG
jgi:uncharacterized protein (DUF433 family)